MASKELFVLEKGARVYGCNGKHPFDLIIQKIFQMNCVIGKGDCHKLERRKKDRLRIICPGTTLKNEPCSFFLNASSLSDDCATIGKTNLNHSCVGPSGREAKIKSSILQCATPVSSESFVPTGAQKGGDAARLQDMMERESGYRPSVATCSRICREKKGNPAVVAVAQYRFLESYFEHLQKEDPGGRYIIKWRQDHLGRREFERALVVPSCSVTFWNASRRCATSDGAHCSSVLQGTLLVFSVLDANQRPMILAFCFTEKENRDGYDFFFSHCREMFSGRLVIIGDGDKGMEFSLLASWREAFLSRCVRHRIENYQRLHPGHRIRRDVIKKYIYLAVRSTTEAEFQFYLNKLRSDEFAEDAIWAWVKQVKDDCCSISFNNQGLRRYGEVVNNTVEQINNVLLEARGEPIIYMVKSVLSWIGKKLYLRKIEAEQMSSSGAIFTPYALTKIEEWRGKSSKWTPRVLEATENAIVGQVNKGTASFVAKISTTKVECSCQKQKELGAPCVHGYTLYNSMQSSHLPGSDIDILDPKFYDRAVYLVEGLVQQYSGKAPRVTVNELTDRDLRPWGVIIAPGKKRKKRFEKAPPPKRQQCASCGLAGHKSTCCPRPCRDKLVEKAKNIPVIDLSEE